MKNEMNEISTPETDAAIKTIGLYRGDEMEIIDPEFARDLERCLTVARAALQAALTASFRGQTGRAHSILDEAITQTAPTQ